MTQQDSADSITVATLNAAALSAVQEETRLPLPENEYRLWRPTKRTRGVIRGVIEAVTCLATDGIRGIFIFDYGQLHPRLGLAFFGHVSNFEWDESIELQVTVKDEETGEKRTHRVTTHKGAPPTLYSKGGATRSSALSGTGGKKKTGKGAAKSGRVSKADAIAALLGSDE